VIQLKRTSSSDKDFQILVSLLDKELSIRDGKDHSFYDQFNKIDSIKEVIVAYENNEPVGCGSIKRYDEHTSEIKRMFVKTEHRSQGVASKILHALEEWSAELHYRACILETGQKQPEAIKLYQKSGYQIISNYGQYVGIKNSVCMKKSFNL
jgi:putative acetyltransferase